jgi:hypothetical protein
VFVRLAHGAFVCPQSRSSKQSGFIAFVCQLVLAISARHLCIGCRAAAARRCTRRRVPS